MTTEQQQVFGGRLLKDESMARHTSWRVGGTVERFYQPDSIEDLALFLKQLPQDEIVYWVGLGSNLLVRDGNIRGTVICTSGVLNNISVHDDATVYVEAGVACPKVAKICARNGLADAEFLCGIPGTMGGALAMNAGAFGGETWSIVRCVTTLDQHGNLYEHTADEYDIGYRSVKGFANEYFVSAVLQLTQGKKTVTQATIKNLLSKRGATQPTNLPNAGSVFRNPNGDYAARLIESCNLKGLCVGGACVSEKHANFIVNTGTATASDIESLIYKVRDIVEAETGILLEPEVRIIGSY